MTNELATNAPILRDTSPFAEAQREAKALASSDLVPAVYRDKMPNCLIALEIARRLGAPPLLVMQNLHIVQGKPAWSSTFLIATANACGRFTPLRFETVGDDPYDKGYKVRCVARDKETGDACIGPWISYRMVEAEGWLGKSGSKWKTMPELMFMYRAAGFWTRVYAPELSMGILTAEEAQDIADVRVAGAPRAPLPGELQALEAKLLGQPAEDVADAGSEPLVALDDVTKRFEAATTLDDLDDAYNDVGLLPLEDRQTATEAYNLARDRIELAAK